MTQQRALVALIAVGLAIVAPRAPWSAAPLAETPRPAISRSGVLGGAHYLIEVPANWRGGLVVFAHGVQRGPGAGMVTVPPIGTHIIAQGHACSSKTCRGLASSGLQSCTPRTPSSVARDSPGSGMIPLSVSSNPRLQVAVDSEPREGTP